MTFCEDLPEGFRRAFLAVRPNFTHSVIDGRHMLVVTFADLPKKDLTRSSLVAASGATYEEAVLALAARFESLWSLPG